jgi:hypothetical protein
MDLTGIMGVVGVVTLTWKFIDFLKGLLDGTDGRKASITQLVVWISGIAAVFLYAESQLGDTVTIGKTTLDHADSATKLIVGLMIGSIASATVDVKKAIDNTDSSKQPPLIK